MKGNVLSIFFQSSVCGSLTRVHNKNTTAFNLSIFITLDRFHDLCLYNQCDCVHANTPHRYRVYFIVSYRNVNSVSLLFFSFSITVVVCVCVCVRLLLFGIHTLSQSECAQTHSDGWLYALILVSYFQIEQQKFSFLLYFPFHFCTHHSLASRHR